MWCRQRARRPGRHGRYHPFRGHRHDQRERALRRDVPRANANTAHVATHTGPDDAADGGARHSVHRDPVAVLATVLDAGDPARNRSALAQATEPAETAASTRTAAELLADAAQLAATERTATALDRLVAGGALSAHDRARIAAEDGAAALTRVLRRAELAGHDPDAVLSEAVERGPLTGARDVTNVIYSRIRDVHRFDPQGETWAQWVPRTDNQEWAVYMGALADAADRRAADLGAEAADAAPEWAVEAFGPVPDSPVDRVEWQEQVGRVAAYREMRGHDDEADVLGPAPQPGQVEEFAAYRAAWRALGRPEIDREHLELSNGQLRMRVRAYERELAAAPRYVANELAGTRQAAAHQQQTAALRRAEADNAADPAERDRLVAEATEAAALAATLDARAAELQEVDDARARWLVHTAETRRQHDLSKAELSARGADDADQQVTAAEWQRAHVDAVTDDDTFREITDSDVQDDAEQDAAVAGPDQDAGESARADLRETATAEAPPVGEDAVRVPGADETAHSLERAGRTLEEIAYRESADVLNEVEQRAAELARWHGDDADVETAEHEASDDAETVDASM